MGEYRIKPSKVLQEEFYSLINKVERLRDCLKTKTIVNNEEYQQYQKELAHAKRSLNEIETKLYVQITKGEV